MVVYLLYELIMLSYKYGQNKLFILFFKRDILNMFDWLIMLDYNIIKLKITWNFLLTYTLDFNLFFGIVEWKLSKNWYRWMESVKTGERQLKWRNDVLIFLFPLFSFSRLISTSSHFISLLVEMYNFIYKNSERKYLPYKV